MGFNLYDGSSEGDDCVGYAASLGVIAPHRGRGPGRALLLTSLREFHGRDKSGPSLGVDAHSLTGATRLYESVGMKPHARYATWEKVLRPGVELATINLS